MKKRIKLSHVVVLVWFSPIEKRLPLAVFETETREWWPAHCQRRHLGEWSFVFPGSKGSGSLHMLRLRTPFKAVHGGSTAEERTWEPFYCNNKPDPEKVLRSLCTVVPTNTLLKWRLLYSPMLFSGLLIIRKAVGYISSGVVLLQMWALSAGCHVFTGVHHEGYSPVWVYHQMTPQPS